MTALHILSGVNQGATIQLEQERVVLGRNPECGVVIPITSVSREHAQIVRVQGRYYIEDMKSRNGTFVNNQQIAARTPLKHNDRIRICDFQAAFVESQRDVGDGLALEEVAAALTANESVEGGGRVVVMAEAASLGEECRRIRSTLETNHVFYQQAAAAGLSSDLLVADSAARKILAEGFHRVVVLDAEEGVGGSGEFDMGRFLEYAYGRLAEAFGLPLGADASYHLEDIAQVLKDEPRSLICLLNIQSIPLADLRRLRGFTQELHQALFLARERRDLAGEEAEYLGLAEDSAIDMVGVEHGRAPDLARLLEITANLSKTLDLDALLPRIVDSLFNLFRQADRGFIILADDDNRLMPKVVKTRRAQDEANARFSRGIVKQCLTEGQAFLSDDAMQDNRIQLSQSVVDFRIRSVMCVPLSSTVGRPFGVIQLDTQDRSKKFTRGDLELLMGVALQASIALENARLYQEALSSAALQREREVSLLLRQTILTEDMPSVPGYELCVAHHPRQKGDGSFHGSVLLPTGRVAVVLGRVSGDGFPAALMMARFWADVRVSLVTEADVATALKGLNDRQVEANGVTDRFIRLSVAVLDPGRHTVTVVVAGEPPPLLYRPGAGSLKEAVPRPATCPPLGVSESPYFRGVEVEIGPAESLLLLSLSAGLYQGSGRKPFGLEDLRQGVAGVGPLTPGSLVSRILASAGRDLAESPHPGSVTLLAVGRT